MSGRRAGASGREAPATRRELLAAGARLAPVASVAAAAALLRAQPAGAAEPGDPGPFSVTDRLQRLIRLELLQLYCYRHVLGSGILRPDARRALGPFVDHELAHRDALAQRLAGRGGAMPAGPGSDREANHDLAHRGIGGRLGQLRGDLDAIRMLLTLEQVTIGAYFVALTKLQDPELVVLCARIMGAEAQHDAVCGLLLPPHKLGSAAPYGLVQGLQ